MSARFWAILVRICIRNISVLSGVLFNCVDFFPHRADEHEEWSWLQEEEELREDREDEPSADGREMDEKSIKDTIAKEDKLGILALGE